MDESDYWDIRFSKSGHTGYLNKLIYQYDQPLRLRFLKRKIEKTTSKTVGKCFKSLDIGSGSGDIMDLLNKSGYQVHGIDISQVAVESTNTRFSDNSKMTCEVADIRTWSYPANTFDLVTSVTVLQYLDEASLLEVLRSLRNSLKSDGRLMVLEICDSKKANIGNTHYDPFHRSHKRWDELFKAAGFTVMTSHSYAPVGPYLVNMISALAGLISSKGSQSYGLNEALQEDTSKEHRSRKAVVGDMLKMTTLKLTRIIDHGLGYNLPKSMADYRLFELIS